MTRSQIIELANTRTDGRAKTLNLKLEFLNALQEFCSESRFYWRKKSITFNTQANVATYDLSSTQITSATTNISTGILIADANGLPWVVTIGTNGILQQNPATGSTATTVGVGSGADVEQIISARYVVGATTVNQLTPIFDTQAIEEIQEATTTGTPGSIMMEPGSSQVVRISPIPAGVYKLRVTYWAIPVVDPNDDAAETIPLVPSRLHRTVAKLLERNILGFLFGEENARFTRADVEYQKQLQQAMSVRDGMIGKVVEYKSREDAIRST